MLHVKFLDILEIVLYLPLQKLTQFLYRTDLVALQLSQLRSDGIELHRSLDLSLL